MTLLQHATGTRGPATARALPARSRPQALLAFHVGSQAYALPLNDIQEVLPMAALSRPPLLPGVLAGFLNVGGAALPVLRLDRLFDLETPTALGRYTPLLRLADRHGGVALLVERVEGIVHVAASDIVPVRDQQGFNDCVTGLMTHDGHVVLVLAAERLLLEKEQQCLAELQDREQARLRALEEAGA